ESVKSMEPNIFPLPGDQLRNPAAHLFGRLVGEGDGHNAHGRHAFGNKFGNTVRDDARLSGPGAGNDQQRTAAVGNRFKLRRIETFGGYRRHYYGTRAKTNFIIFNKKMN